MSAEVWTMGALVTRYLALLLPKLRSEQGGVQEIKQHFSASIKQ